jgi:hypothetical protein
MRTNPSKKNVTIFEFIFVFTNALVRLKCNENDILFSGISLAIKTDPMKIISKYDKTKNLCLSNPCGKSIMETQIYTRYKEMNSIKGANLKASFKYFLFFNIVNPEKINSIQNVSGNDCIKSSEKMLSLIRKSDIE